MMETSRDFYQICYGKQFWVDKVYFRITQWKIEQIHLFLINDGKWKQQDQQKSSKICMMTSHVKNIGYHWDCNQWQPDTDKTLYTDIRLYFDTWNFKENTQGWRDLMHARDYEHLDSIQVTLGTSCDYKDQRHINWDNFNIDSPKMMNSAKWSRCLVKNAQKMHDLPANHL